MAGSSVGSSGTLVGVVMGDGSGVTVQGGEVRVAEDGGRGKGRGSKQEEWESE